MTVLSKCQTRNIQDRERKTTRPADRRGCPAGQAWGQHPGQHPSPPTLAARQMPGPRAGHPEEQRPARPVKGWVTELRSGPTSFPRKLISSNGRITFSVTIWMAKTFISHWTLHVGPVYHMEHVLETDSTMMVPGAEDGHPEEVSRRWAQDVMWSVLDGSLSSITAISFLFFLFF